jgi:hypothetical protein
MVAKKRTNKSAASKAGRSRSEPKEPKPFRRKISKKK